MPKRLMDVGVTESRASNVMWVKVVRKDSIAWDLMKDMALSIAKLSN
jgi:hypothetical protein